MRRDTFLVILLFTALCLQGGAQTSQSASGQDHGVTTPKNITEPLPKQPTYRPKLSLQDALKIAEGYIGKEHIDVAPLWLYRAMYILSGDEHSAPKDKIPGWHFWWVSEAGGLGNYVEIFVDMEGRAHPERLPCRFFNWPRMPKGLVDRLNLNQTGIKRCSAANVCQRF